MRKEKERGRESKFGIPTLYIERQHTWQLQFEAEFEISGIY